MCCSEPAHLRTIIQFHQNNAGAVVYSHLLNQITSIFQNVLFSPDAPSYRVTAKHKGTDGYAFDYVHVYLANGGGVRCTPPTVPHVIDNTDMAILSCVY